MREDRDEMIDRIVDELKVLPAVPADASARVLARIDAARVAGSTADVSDQDIEYFPAASDEMAEGRRAARPAAPPPSRQSLGRRFMISLPAAVGYALAATLAGFLIRGAVPAAVGPADVARQAVRTPDESGRAQTLSPVALSQRALQEAPVNVQFVLDAKAAKTVSLVGDFNGWDAAANVLTRDSATGVWTTYVPVHPGRHVYAFLVDGSTWTLDPSAPRTKDPDYGTEQSVMLVGLR